MTHFFRFYLKLEYIRQKTRTVISTGRLPFLFKIKDHQSYMYMYNNKNIKYFKLNNGGIMVIIFYHLFFGHHVMSSCPGTYVRTIS